MTGASETGNCLHRTLTTHTLAEMCKLLVEMLSIRGKQTLDIYYIQAQTLDPTETSYLTSNTKDNGPWNNQCRKVGSQ